jgi:hypothetical protein
MSTKQKHKRAVPVRAVAVKKSFSERMSDWWHEWQWVILAFAAGRLIMWLCYPNPLMLTDTTEFLISAETFHHNPYKPIGYSLFAALVKSIFPGAAPLLLIQTLIRLFATIRLLKVLKQYWKLDDGILNAFGILCALEPLALMADHYLLSDSLFLSFVILILAALLKYIKKPGIGGAVSIWFSLTLAMVVRHNGLFYFGAVVLLILLIHARDWWFHLGIIVVGFLLVVLTIMWRFQADQGRFELTAFDGWATYGGVAYMIDTNPNYYEKLNDPEMRAIYKYFASAPDSIYHPPRSDNWYRWNQASPAKRYLYELWMDKNNPLTYHQAFVRTNDVLRKLTHDIILHRPVQYLRDFYVPNVLRATLWPTVEDADTRIFNYTGQKHEYVDQILGVKTETWKANFHLFGAGAYLLPFWVAFWWLVILAGLIVALKEHAQWSWKALRELALSDLRVLMAVFMIIITPVTALGHFFYVRYATPNMPLLLLAGAITLAPFVQKWWTRPDAEEPATTA